MKKLEVSANDLHPSHSRRDATSSHSISRLERIRLGGTEQWIRIQGKDTSYPVLLLIQQGPGYPMINEAADDHKLWHLEDDFVVVYWDQRACGKSYSRTISPQSMTVEQLITDTHELIQMLTHRFQVAQLYVAGFSFGGTIAALVDFRHPQLVRGVVCVDLDVQFDVAERVAYDFALEQATRRRNNRALRELRRMGPPPHLNSKSFGTRARWVTNFGGANRQATYTRLLLKILRQLVLSRDYTLSDIVGTLRGIGSHKISCCLISPTSTCLRCCQGWTFRCFCSRGDTITSPHRLLQSSTIRRYKRPKASSSSGSTSPRTCPSTKSPANFGRPCSLSSSTANWTVRSRTKACACTGTTKEQADAYTCHLNGIGRDQTAASSWHLSVIVLEDDHAVFLAGDTSYNQALMLEQAVDGVAPNEQISRQMLQRIQAYVQKMPTIYLPSHDPEAKERLFQRQTVLLPEGSKAAL